MKTNYPKIGIRPTIDGRQGGIREGLEEKTMNLAKAVKNLIESNLRNGDGSPVECVISNTTIGRAFYAVGGNEKATKLSGINTNKVYFLAYTNMGFLSALAAMVTIARLTSAQPTYGQNYEMDAIGSCFIGGASAYGGIGTVPGVIVGAALMGVINMGMSLMGVDANMQKVVKGGVLLIAVIFDVVSKRGKWIAKN